jgi:2-dehydro-3-deoxyphosphogluconate aldolase / (4S)-4-hydroxy-2-oxoglutarate aldolase
LPWSKEQSLSLIRELAVIPVVRVPSYEHAMCAVRGILDSGVNIVEITLTVPNACSIIRELTTKYGQKLLVGAGTVLDVENCKQALEAGADFIVSPAFDKDVVGMARQHNKIAVPGALTPTEIVTAWNTGADMVKIFPCNALGGTPYIRALRGPFPNIEFVITGGVTIDTAPEFLAAGASAVGVGESVLLPDALAKNDHTTVGAAVRKFAAALKTHRSR